MMTTTAARRSRTAYRPRTIPDSTDNAFLAVREVLEDAVPQLTMDEAADIARAMLTAARESWASEGIQLGREDDEGNFFPSSRNDA